MGLGRWRIRFQVLGGGTQQKEEGSAEPHGGLLSRSFFAPGGQATPDRSQTAGRAMLARCRESLPGLQSDCTTSTWYACGTGWLGYKD